MQTTMAFDPPAYLSPSSLSTFKQCPLRFKYTKIDGVREPDTEATVLGSFVHEVLEIVFSLDPHKRTIEASKNIATSLWNDGGWKTKVSAVIGSRDDLLRDFRWRSWWCLENYFSLENPAEIIASGIEDEVNDSIEGVKIKGFIDRWSETDSGIVISDYKTGKTPAPRYRADKFTQLMNYAIHINKRLNKMPSNLELLYLKDGTRLTSDVNQQGIDTVTNMIVTTNEEILKRCEVGKFEYKTSKLCDWCSFKRTCPAWN